MDIITKLTKVLEERKKADPNMSYVKELYKNGTDKILKKIEEETLELINATREVGGDREKRMIEETADRAARLIETLPKTGIIFLFHQVCKMIRLLDHPHNVMHI